MEQTRFDLTARRVARLDPVGFFCWLLLEFAQHLRFAGWLDTRTTPQGSDPEVTGDTIARLEALHEVGPPWMFPVEFQTVPDPGMFGRLHKLVGEWWSDLRPDELPDSRYQVCAGVVNLTGTRESAPASRQYRLPGPGNLSWGCQVREVHLADESAEATLNRVEKDDLLLGITPLIVLMKGAGEPGNISKWVTLVSQVKDTRRRADLGSLALTLAALMDWFDAWKQALKGWNMQESQFVLDLQREKTLANLKVFLEERFGALPADLKQRIEAITDLNRLDQLVRAAGRAKTLEDFTV